MPAPAPIDGLYVHVPFCDGKCHYCAFYSVPFQPGRCAAWLASLKAEWEDATHHWGPLNFSTIFMGGGTPTLLPREELEVLLTMFQGACASGCEWSCEANPGSLDGAKLSLMKSYGVNRISLGVQSLEDGVLRRLGRRHTVADVHEAVALIKAAGFANWSIDLIACVPGVTAAAWRETLLQAAALDSSHFSVYSLTSEEGTQLARDQHAGTVELLDDEDQLAMLDMAEEILGARGMVRYEISNYARPGFECRHNLSCWRGLNYLGLGCAAASRVGNRRWTNVADLDAYVSSAKRHAITREEETLSPVTDACERLVFGLRMREGVDLEKVLAVTSLVGSAQEQIWRRTLSRLGGDGLLVGRDGRWCLSPRGIALADHVAVELMP